MQTNLLKPKAINVEPLGEPLGASVLPDGFVVVLGVLLVAGALPTVDAGGSALLSLAASASVVRAACLTVAEECVLTRAAASAVSTGAGSALCVGGTGKAVADCVAAG